MRIASSDITALRCTFLGSEQIKNFKQSSCLKLQEPAMLVRMCVMVLVHYVAVP